MTGYRRPKLPAVAFRDESGQRIPYGARWDDPPEWANSELIHPERFAPLHVVADALIEHLVASYDVEVEQDPPVRRPRAEWVRAVRLTPGAGAPLTVVWTDLPGLDLGIGASEHRLPGCGCDACDDDVAELLDSLEGLVLALAEGRYHEWPGGHWFDLGSAGGQGEGSGPPGALDDHRVAAWPQRTAS